MNLLTKIFCCHNRSDRSFFIRGQKLPLCARCTGIFIGIILGIIIFLLYKIKISILILLLFPLCIDGFSQSFFCYESTNNKRLFTGLLFGISLVNLFIYSTIYFFLIGYNLNS